MFYQCCAQVVNFATYAFMFGFFGSMGVLLAGWTIGTIYGYMDDDVFI